MITTFIPQQNKQIGQMLLENTNQEPQIDFKLFLKKGIRMDRFITTIPTVKWIDGVWTKVEIDDRKDQDTNETLVKEELNLMNQYIQHSKRLTELKISQQVRMQDKDAQHWNNLRRMVISGVHRKYLMKLANRFSESAIPFRMTRRR